MLKFNPRTPSATMPMTMIAPEMANQIFQRLMKSNCVWPRYSLIMGLLLRGSWLRLVVRGVVAVMRSQWLTSLVGS